MFVVAVECDHDGMYVPRLVPLTDRANKILGRIDFSKEFDIAIELYNRLCERNGYDCCFVHVKEYTSSSGCHGVEFTFRPTLATKYLDFYAFEVIAAEGFVRRYKSPTGICFAVLEKHLEKAINVMKSGGRIGFIMWRVSRGYRAAWMVRPIYDRLPLVSMRSLLAALI